MARREVDSGPRQEASLPAASWALPQWGGPRNSATQAGPTGRPDYFTEKLNESYSAGATDLLAMPSRPISEKDHEASFFVGLPSEEIIFTTRNFILPQTHPVILISPCRRTRVYAVQAGSPFD